MRGRRRNREICNFVNGRNRIVHSPFAETILLPDKRTEVSEFFYSRRRASVYASVAKGKHREECQDTVVAFMDKKFSLIGVFDGFGKFGTILSDKVAEKVIELCHEMRKQMRNANNLTLLFKDAVIDAMCEIKGTYSGSGTTGTVALILNNGKYFIVSIGDSGVYIAGRKKTERLFEYEWVMHSEDGDKFKKTHVTELRFNEYYVDRNMLEYAITKKDSEGIMWRALEFAHGVLGKKQMLILVTDGVTKNLKHKVDIRTNKMLGVSGCDNINEIVGSVRDVRLIGGAILSTAKMHIRDDKGIFVTENETAYLSADDDLSVVVFSNGF